VAGLGAAPEPTARPEALSRPGGATPVRRVVLPAAAPAVDGAGSSAAGQPAAQRGAPVTPARPTLPPYQAQPFSQNQAGPRRAEPEPVRQPYQPRVGPSDASAGTWEPSARPFVAPAVVQPSVGAAMTAPVPSTAPDRPAFQPTGFGAQGHRPGEGAPTAFVPAGVRPVVGQSFGTMRVAPSIGAVDATVGAAPSSPIGDVGSGVVESAAPSVPRWGNVTPGQGWAPAPSPTPVGAVASADEAPDADDVADELPRHPYTWLHMIVLVLVAFVLGMLIFVVLLRDSDPGGTQGAGTVGDVAAWSRAAALTVGRAL
jgi:hypothetical protein